MRVYFLEKVYLSSELLLRGVKSRTDLVYVFVYVEVSYVVTFEEDADRSGIVLNDVIIRSVTSVHS